MSSQSPRPVELIRAGEDYSGNNRTEYKKTKPWEAEEGIKFDYCHDSGLV